MLRTKLLMACICLLPVISFAQFESQISNAQNFASGANPSSSSGSLNSNFNPGSTSIGATDPMLGGAKAPTAAGQGTLAQQGTGNIANCKASPSGAGCNAVNMLANYGGGNVSLPANDPALLAAQAAINASGAGGPFSPGTQCQTVTIVDKAATFQNQSCVQSAHIICNKTLDVACAFVSKDVSNISTTGSATINHISTGLYDYAIPLSGAGVGSPYRATITFNIDSPSMGSYITAIANSLDDTAVAVVNGIVVYFGHPNSGGQWGYPDFGTVPGYEWGYSDNLQSCSMVQQVSGYDSDGNPIYTTDQNGSPVMVNQCNTIATSQFKLSDSCIAGDSSNKTGTPAMWCTSDGKTVGRTVEGNGYRTVTINTSLPLLQGQNTIELLWGNEWGNYGGGITLTGQIYNVAPACTTMWNDGCTALETSAGQVTIPK